MENPTLVIIVGILAVWLLQGVLVYWQSRQIYGHVTLQRQLGRQYIGVHRSLWGSREYGMLILDDQGQIIQAELLKGFTIFARFRPVAPLVGMSAHDILALPEGPTIADLSKGSMMAFRQAATKAADDPAGKE